VLAAFAVMIFKTMLARVVAGQQVLDRAFPSQALGNGLRYLAFLGLATAAIVAIVVPSAALLALVGVMGANLLPLLGLALSIAIVVGTVLLAFVGEAIVLTGAGPWQAVRTSAGIVRAHTLPTVGLLLVLWVALASLPPLLAPLGANTLGIALAVLLYAFIATGLAIGRMVFVKERLPRQPAAPRLPAPGPSQPIDP
jgi:hypothetical protein